MDINVKIEVELSASTKDFITSLVGNGGWKPVEESAGDETAKVKRIRAPKAEKVVDTEPEEKKEAAKKVDLSTIREWVNATDARKTRAKSLFPKYGIKAFTELPESKFNEFFAEVQQESEEL